MPGPTSEEKLDVLIPRIIGVCAAAATFVIIGAVIWHFWVGSDIPLIAIANYQSAAYWGQIGDFIGGLLNPLLSFVALMAVLYSVNMQRRELKLARGDARENYRIQIQQRQNFERQNFESVFFRLLDIHARLVAELKLVKDKQFYEDAYETLIGRDAFEYVGGRLRTNGSTASEYAPHVVRAVDTFERFHSVKFAHYFRNFYQILKHVESFGVDPLKMDRKYSFLLVRQLVQQYKTQRVYANMLRAQLDSEELAVLFMNCLTVKGEGLKYYVERYSMLKHFDQNKMFPAEPKICLTFFDELAFADGENVGPAQLRAHYKALRPK